MSESILIIGETGSGKSSAIRTLDAAATFIIQVTKKSLPYRGWQNKYGSFVAGKGNLFISDSSERIIKCIDFISEKMPHVKTIVIDDFQYVMGNEFMRRAREKGYEKFTEIGVNAWSIINVLGVIRDDLIVFVLSHSEEDSFGKTKMKTIGKMLDDKITIEGMFTIVLNAKKIDQEYVFLTQNDGNNIAKSPMEMFESEYIPNDLEFVRSRVIEYRTGE